jgi:hypothetical protein
MINSESEKKGMGMGKIGKETKGNFIKDKGILTKFGRGIYKYISIYLYIYIYIYTYMYIYIYICKC